MERSEKVAITPQWVLKQLDALFEQSLIYGMPPQEFWNEDPSRITAYRNAYKHRLQREENQAHRAGEYVYAAVSTALSNAFGGKRSKAKYPQKPIEFFPDMEEKRVEAKEKKRIERENNDEWNRQRLLRIKEQSLKKAQGG